MKKTKPSSKNEKGLIWFCLPIVVALILGIFLIIFIPAAGWGIGQEEEGTITQTPTTQLTGIPTGWNQIIQEAAKEIDVPPLIVAAIYLTEHHTTTFGGDINPAKEDPNCEISYAGARGPWQLMPNWWYGDDAPLVKNASKWKLKIEHEKVGLKFIPYVNVCYYREAAFGGAYVIRAKMNNANIYKKYNDSLTDEKVKEIAKRYCGGCTDRGCGNANFNYCEFALERYKELVVAQ